MDSNRPVTGSDGTAVVRYATEEELERASPVEEYSKLDNTLRDMEVRLLNPSSWIPGWSTVTGAMQVVLGLVMIVLSGLASLYEVAKGVCTANVVEKRQHYKQAAFNLNYAKHGALNIFRGAISMIPFIGNATMYLYDNKRAEERYKYPTEA